MEKLFCRFMFDLDQLHTCLWKNERKHRSPKVDGIPAKNSALEKDLETALNLNYLSCKGRVTRDQVNSLSWIKNSS